MENNMSTAPVMDQAPVETPVEMAPPPVAPMPNLSQTEIPAPKYAGGWIRFLAYIIDAIIIGIVLNIFRSIGGETAYNMASILGIVYIYLMIAIKQQTLGMMALKLRVISSESGTVNWWIVTLMRQIVGGLVCGITLGIGYLIIFFTAKKQGLHDMIGKTYVIRE